MSSRAEELRRRREALLAQTDAERSELGEGYARIAVGVDRADGWLKLARRVTPLAAVGAIAIGLLVGPGRIVRLLQTAAVPALLLRQVLGRSAAPGEALRTVLRLLMRRDRTD